MLAFDVPLPSMAMLLLAPTELELSAITFEHPKLIKRICGVGGVAIARDLIPILHEDTFDLILLVGLAGGFKNESNLSEVVKIDQDTQGDLGVFQNNEYISFVEIGLIPAREVPPAYNVVDRVLPEIASRDALSTNILFAEDEKNALRHAHYDTQVESMEGATFQEICEEYQVPYLQLRAISNYIGERDKSKWKIKEALGNLNIVVTAYLKSIL